MRLHTVAKIGGVISIILFLIGVGMYGFARLSEEGQGKNVDLLALVPRDCVGVLETDNLDFFSNEFPKTSYAEHLVTHQEMGVIQTVVGDITSISSLGAHRLGNQMNHLVVSFHAPYSVDNVVAYFKMDKNSKRLLSKIFSEKEGGLAPKVESYRGEDIAVYPLQNTRFVSVYSKKGYLVVSYQKRLIERVIDAQKDEATLQFDSNFTDIRRTKSANFMTFYAKTTAAPVLCKDDSSCWSDFEVHLNSDVFYLTGGLYNQFDNQKSIEQRSVDAGLLADSSKLQCDNKFLLAVGRNQVDSCISEAIITPHDALFDECVSTLSRDASYIMVADLAHVYADAERYKKCIPNFVMRNLRLFNHFILSVQLTELDNRLSHILVFTYKD